MLFNLPTQLIVVLQRILSNLSSIKTQGDMPFYGGCTFLPQQFPKMQPKTILVVGYLAIINVPTLTWARITREELLKADHKRCFMWQAEGVVAWVMRPLLGDETGGVSEWGKEGRGKERERDVSGCIRVAGGGYIIKRCRRRGRESFRKYLWNVRWRDIISNHQSVKKFLPLYLYINVCFTPVRPCVCKKII